jgi:hypothetical protein
MLTSAELARIRTDIERLMPDTCTILSLTAVSDAQGGFTETWGTATANVKCRLDAAQQGRGQEALEAGAITPFTYWMLTLPHGTSISTEQRVVVVTAGSGANSGGTFNVQAVDSGKSWSGCVRATLGKL